MKPLHWLLVAGLLALALQGCVALVGAGGAAAYSMMEDRRSSGTQIDDQGIELGAIRMIHERFPDDKRVHVDVTSFNRTVLLSGEVPDAATREEVEKIVYGIANVRAMTNEVQIAPVSSTDARGNDAFITSKIKTRFLQAAKFNPLHVKVFTEAAVVYLLGIVTDAEAADAVEIARTTSGVRKVVKMFEYCKPDDEVCRPRAQSPAAGT